VILPAVVFLALQAGEVAPSATTTQKSASAATATMNDSPSQDLLKIRRVYVDNFGQDTISREMQSMIVSALVASKKFVVTENREHADAILKGVALEKTSQELHSFGEGTSVSSAAGGHSAQINGSNGSFSGSSNGGFAASGAGISDSSLNTETIDRARVSIRLVNSDGDVIWTTTQESKGAKYRGASADAAEMCVKQLIRDISKLQTAAAGQRTVSPALSTATHP